MAMPAPEAAPHPLQGMERIYEVKHRQAHVPLAICVADVGDVARYGATDHLPDSLLRTLLPGAVTVILARRPQAALCQALNPGVSSIGASASALHIATDHPLSGLFSLTRTH